jgi:hypothetical protein
MPDEIIDSLAEFSELQLSKKSSKKNITERDHSLIHELFALFPKIKYFVKSDSLAFTDEDKLIQLHIDIVKELKKNNIEHYYNYDALDHTLPDDMKEYTIGFPIERDIKSNLFGFSESFDEESLFFKDIGEEEAKLLWSAPKNRASLPASYFLDPKNKKYPVKDPKTGKYNCVALRTAAAYASGARGAPKRPLIAAKAKRLYKIHCGGK